MSLINNYLYNKKQFFSVRLSVRTRGFHPRKRGSIPLGIAPNMSYYVYLIQSVGSKRNKTYVGYTNNLKEEFRFTMTIKVQKQLEVLNGYCYFKKSFIQNLRLCLMNIKLKKIEF